MDNDTKLRGRFQFGLSSLLLFFVAAAFVLGWRTLEVREREAGIRDSCWMGTSPVGLHVVYTENTAKRRTYPGDPGGVLTERWGKVKYTFKNRWPVRVKIAFPPISYRDGGGRLDYAAAVSDVNNMPAFCRQPRLVELDGYEAISFEGSLSDSSFSRSFSQSPPRSEFIFGNPTGSQDPELVICPVVSTSELRAAE